MHQDAPDKDAIMLLCAVYPKSEGDEVFIFIKTSVTGLPVTPWTKQQLENAALTDQCLELAKKKSKFADNFVYAL